MFRVSIRRVCESRAPFEFCVENYVDWTHFVYVHRASHVQYRLIHKDGRRCLFLYRARPLRLAPWTDDYIVFREVSEDGAGYLHAYLHVKTGRLHRLEARTIPNGETTLMTAEFLFELSDWWRLFPRLFFWIFRWRMRRVMHEDNAVLREWLELGRIPRGPCSPEVPETFNLIDTAFPGGALSREADVRFEDHFLENFAGVKRAAEAR